MDQHLAPPHNHPSPTIRPNHPHRPRPYMKMPFPKPQLLNHLTNPRPQTDCPYYTHPFLPPAISIHQHHVTLHSNTNTPIYNNHPNRPNWHMKTYSPQTQHLNHPAGPDKRPPTSCL